MTTSEILTKARALLAEKGLAKKALMRPGGSVCSLGAINVADLGQAVTLRPYTPRGAQASRIVARCATGDWRLTTLVNWNNAPERTLQDVLDAFDAAIAIAQHEEAASVVQTVEPQPEPQEIPVSIAVEG